VNIPKEPILFKHPPYFKTFSRWFVFKNYYHNFHYYHLKQMENLNSGDNTLQNLRNLNEKLAQILSTTRIRINQVEKFLEEQKLFLLKSRIVLPPEVKYYSTNHPN
ncbi:MAG: hypothetical protein WBH03_18065, partial [Cyclobacteriaceae bacterium]